ncbi:unnamed protein product [Leptidea sinapis]|uniref:PHD-type domain-containing protein n=1 Tax=Leptidea sinapis TaxID=189913 RepID=A0A5E4PSE6_9NEOP|nr:unnamed protein product [Leptidea sinapis]
MNKKCSGCPNVLKNIALLNCSKRRDKYHYSCLNFNREDYLELSKSIKDSWICPLCRSKEPKGDNNNTPVRTHATLTQESDECFSQNNITLRSKKSNCNCVSSEHIRDIIREELQNLVFCNKTILELSPSPQPLSVVDPAHHPLNFSLPFRSYSKLDHNNNIKLKFHEADYDNIIKELNSTDWEKNLKLELAFWNSDDIDDLIDLAMDPPTLPVYS